MLHGSSVAVDGSKFKAVNHREKNFTRDRLMRRMAGIVDTIARYLTKLDRADRQSEVCGTSISEVR